MSDMNSLGRTITLNCEMKNQITSMLKNVIDDEPQDEGNFEEEIHDSIFDQPVEDGEDDDGAETQTNTTIGQIGFSRSHIEKSQTTKMHVAMPFSKGQAKEVFIDSSEISRKTAKKFQTINMKFNPINSHFASSQMNFHQSLSNAISPFSLGYAMPMPMQMPMQMQMQMPMPMPMPVMSMNTNTNNNLHNCLNNNENAFSRKQKKQLNHHQGPLNEDYAISEIELMLAPTHCFDKETYEKLKDTFIKLSKNQRTSRLCQSYIDSTPGDVIHLIFQEMRDQIAHLLLDPYANYFCLKLFYYLNNEDRFFFLDQVSFKL